MNNEPSGRSTVSNRSRVLLVPLILGIVATLLGVVPIAASPTADVAVAAVPTPDATSSVITVQVGADRTGADFTDISALAGTQLGLFATAAATSPVNGTWAICTSDADGDCSFTVPDTNVGGTNRNQRFFVKQISAPSGWYMNPTLRTGSAAASPSNATQYAFQTGTSLVEDTTYRSTVDFMYVPQVTDTESVQTASNGIWQQSRNNPALPVECGLDVALIIDLSTSVNAEIDNLLGAANTFTDALTGTPSRMAVFSLGTLSPARDGANYPNLISVATPSGAAAFKSQYADWAPYGGTNWDRAFMETAQAAPHYDVAVMITDGNPSVYNDPVAGPNTNYNRFREMEYAIASANTLKAEGTRIISTAVGSGVTNANTALNLRAITGQTAYNGANPLTADYYQLASYAGAGDALRQLASGLCEGSVSVVKQIVPSGNTGEDITGATPAPAGWQFTSSTTTAGVTGLPSTQTTTNDGTGAVQFPLSFTAGVTSAAVTVKEAQQADHVLVTQGGDNAVCRNITTGAAVSVTNDNSTPGNPGFRVNAPSNAAITCTIYNKPQPNPGNLVVSKSSSPVSGTVVAPGDFIDYTVRLRNTGGQPVTGVDHTDYMAGVLDDATLVSGPTSSSANLTATTQGVPVDRFRVVGTVPAGADYAVTYRVQVKPAGAAFGDGRLDNFVRTTGTNPPATCLPADTLCTTHPIPGNLSMTKASDPVSGTALNPGQSAMYTLTFRNTGGQPMAVDHDDVLTDVLDDADVSNIVSSNANLTVTGPTAGRLSIVGNVHAGATYTVTYTVSVPNPVKTGGNGVLNNYLLSDGATPPTTCVEATNLCTTHPIPGDLQVSKSSDPVDGSAVAPGSTVDYTITFRNAGGSAVAVDHTDHLAELLDDATITTGPVASDPDLNVNPSPLGGASQFNITGLVPAGATYTVTYTATVNTTGFGDGVLTNVVVEGDEPPGDCEAGDPLCTEHPVEGKLSVVKASDPMSGEEAAPGSDVTYTLTFENTGGSPIDVDHIDHLTDVIDDADLVSDPTAQAPLTATLAGDGASFAVTGSLPAGGVATVTYTVSVKNADFGDGNLLNVVRPEGEEPPTECVAGDRLCTEHPVPADLSVTKTADPVSGAQVAPGDVITYTLSFVNGGGRSAVVDYTDYLAAVLDDAELTMLPTASDADRTVTMAGDGQSFSVVGIIPAATAYTVSYEVTVNDDDFGNGVLDNFVRRSDETPPGPGDGCEGADTLCTTHPVPGIVSVVKSSSPPSGTVVAPGSDVDYALTFTNSGGRAVDVDYTDYLSELLDDASVTDGPTSSDPSLAVTPTPLGNASAFTVSGSLGAGETVTVTYTATVKTEDFGDGRLTNVVVKGDEPAGPCVSPDPLCTEHPVEGNLTVTKFSDPASGTVLATGDEVTYTLRFNNTGGSPVDVEYTDHLAKVLDDADLVLGPAFSGPGDGLDIAALAAGTFMVNGELAADTSVEVTYKVKVKAVADRGDSVLANFLVEGDAEPPAECADATRNCTEHPVGDLEVSKSVNPASHSVVATGQELTYRLTFVNHGGLGADVDYSDQLAKVLDDARISSAPQIVGPAAGLHVSPVSNQRFVVVGELAVGATVIVEYKVVVKEAADRGDSVLTNFLVHGDVKPPATCPVEMPRGKAAVETREGNMCTENPVGDFSVTKSSNPASGTKVAVGDVVQYTLTFKNTGATAHVVNYTDYLAEVLDDAVVTEEPSVRGQAHGLNVSAITDQTFTVTGEQDAETTVRVVYAVQVHDSRSADGALDNFLTEGDTSPPVRCTDSTENCTHHPVVHVTLIKDPGHDGWLPNTGGPALILLLGGLAALTAGLLFMRRGRRE